jgi:hypothetical protein
VNFLRRLSHFYSFIFIKLSMRCTLLHFILAYAFRHLVPSLVLSYTSGQAHHKKYLSPKRAAHFIRVCNEGILLLNFLNGEYSFNTQS